MFKIPRTEAHFGKINVRPEHHGEEIKPAVDVPFSIQGGKRLMDMLLPMQEGPKFSEVYYTDAGVPNCLAMSPISVHRKPDALNVTIWDSPTKKTQMLKFGGAKAKNLTLTMHPKFKCELSGTIQVEIDADRDAARLVNLMEQDREVEIIATQPDLFDGDNDEDGEGEGGGQTDIDDDPDASNDAE